MVNVFLHSDFFLNRMNGLENKKSSMVIFLKISNQKKFDQWGITLFQLPGQMGSARYGNFRFNEKFLHVLCMFFEFLVLNFLCR